MKNSFERISFSDEEAYGEKFILGSFLLKCRKSTKRFIKDIAEALGVSKSAVIGWEDGRSFPEEEKLPDIARVYGVELSELKKRFDISKQSRMSERSFRKNMSNTVVPKIDKNTEVFVFPDNGASRSGRGKR